MKNLLPQLMGLIINYRASSNASEAIAESWEVAVDHSQLWTMESETIDPIDRAIIPTLYRLVPPEHHLHGEMHATNYMCNQLNATAGSFVFFVFLKKG